MGFARPITAKKSNDCFVKDHVFHIADNEIVLKCLIDTGADKSLVNEAAVMDYKASFYNVNPLTFRSLTTSFSLDKKIDLCLDMESDRCDRLVEHGFYVSRREFVSMPFDAIIGKDLLARLNATISFGNGKIMAVNISDAVQHAEHDENAEAVLDTDLDRNEIYLPTASSSFAELQINDPDLYSLLKNYELVFSSECGKMDERFALDLKLLPTVTKAISVPPRKVPMHFEEEVRAQIKTLLERGLIEPTESRYTFPVVLAKKKSGELRMCIDFKELNKATVKESTLLPQFEELRNKLGQATIFSAIDFSQGYWHIPLSNESQRLVCFSPGPGMGNYTCKVMPFGLTQAPGHFQRVMNQIFGDLPYVFVYIDDVLIFSENKDQHMQHLREVFARIERHGLRVKAKKCSFAVREVTYLGHVFSNGTYHYDKKTKHLFSGYPLPVTLKDLESFIGTANYYRKFIPNFSTLLKPLYDFKKDVDSNLQKCLTWSVSLINSFHEICSAIVNATPLKIPDRLQEFTLQTDASDYGLGATLLQNNVPISYASRLLKSPEKKFSTYEKELLAVIFGCKMFRDCLLGKKFKLNTDHQPLIWLQSQKLTGRLGRWILALREYDFEVEYIPGKSNVVADNLSRTICVILPENSIRKREWSKLHAADTELAFFIKGDERFSSRLYKPYSKHFSVNNNIVYFKKERIVVPESEVSSLLQDTHTTLGHCGYQRMVDYLKNKFFWPGFYQSIKDFLKTCMACSLSKSYRIRKFPEYQYCGDKPFEKISMDLKCVTQCNGFSYIMVIQDTYSRFVNFYPLKRKSSECVLDKFQHFLCTYGKPMSVLTDEGMEFKGYFDKFCTDFAILHTTSSPYHHSGNGMVERTNRWLEERLITDRQQWPNRLPYWQFLFNQLTNSATGVSPSYLVFSFEPTLLFDGYFCSGDDTRSMADNNGFKVGDHVLVKDHGRLKQRPYFYKTKFEIVEILGCTAKLVCLDGDYVLKRHFSQIKKIL